MADLAEVALVELGASNPVMLTAKRHINIEH